MHYTLIGYAISFIILFTNFYIQTYIKRGRGRRSKDAGKVGANGTAVHGNGYLGQDASETAKEHSKKEQ